jgi:FkbM family methyltransferase
MSKSTILQTGGFNQLATGRDCHYLYNHNDLYVGRALERYGEFSALEMDLLKQLCAPGHCVIEVGANVGAHTVGLARLVGTTGRVLAFEPQRLVFQTLCANLAINSVENVECYWAAVGPENTVVVVPEPSPHEPYNFGGVSLLGASKGCRVVCVMLDNFVELPRVNLLKIDVEGMEADVIRGGAALIKRHKPILYVENDRMEKSKELIELIAGLGYQLYWHTPPLYNPNNYNGESENLFPSVVSANMLCLSADLNANIDGLQEIRDSSFHPFSRPGAILDHLRGLG